MLSYNKLSLLNRTSGALEVSDIYYPMIQKRYNNYVMNGNDLFIIVHCIF